MFCRACYDRAIELITSAMPLQEAVEDYKLKKRQLKMLDKSSWDARMQDPNMFCLDCGQMREFSSGLPKQ